MKYGLYYYKNTHNIGDDIWAYAQSLFYPRIDYLIDNTTVYKFQSLNDEDVATIIGAFVEPYNFEYSFLPPPNIIPFFIGAYFRSTLWDFLKSEKVNAFLKAYQPIGIRSFTHLDCFSEMGIEAYYSGCITLTLPALDKIEGGYICLVDVPEFIIDCVRNTVGSRFELKVMTHMLPNMGQDVYLKHRELAIDKRFALVKERIQLYANAHCVVTSKLHCALPCLTQNTPVLLTLPRDGEGTPDMQARIGDSASLLHVNYYDDFVENNVPYDFICPPANPGEYHSYRGALIQKCTDFIQDCENGNMQNKCPYGEKERQAWLIERLQEKVQQLKGVVDAKNVELRSVR